jgi:hypothetical protein
MRKLLISTIVSILIFANSFGQKESKSIIGVSGGIVIPGSEYTIWLGDNIDHWAKRKVSPIFQVYYAYEIIQHVRLGGYFEYEDARFDFDYMTNLKAKRYGLGINWLACIPISILQLQLGGYTGGTFGTSDLPVWTQTMKGFEMGILGGPAYEVNNIGFAINVHSGFAWLFNSSNQPKDVLLVDPKILFKIYYKL